MNSLSSEPDPRQARVAYFLSHPIQYQSPLLRQAAEDGLRIVTVYGDIRTAERFFDKDYGEEISWERPLLEGYEWDVLEQPARESWHGWKRSSGDWLDRHPVDAVWVHGWGTAFSVGCLLAAHQRGLPILLRGETHRQSLRGGPVWQWLHRRVLSKVFDQVEQLLAIGTANRELYQRYGVPARRISLVPYAADNRFFQAACREASNTRETLRRRLDLPADRPVILFVGRLSPEKDIVLLLKALRLVNGRVPEAMRPVLLIAGNGPLRERLTRWSAEHLPQQVRFAGFVPQTQLPGLYDLCDVFVLPSRFEPWGMVVNEAMNAGRPVIVSDRVGAGADLVRDGWNGFRFRCGDVGSLAEALEQLVTDSRRRQQAGANSLHRINEWGIDKAVAGLRDAIARLPAKEIAAGEDLRSSHRDRADGRRRKGVILAYIGVHEIFQMAIAAEEAGQLESLHCSLFDGPDRWGRLASGLAHVPSARPLGGDILPPAKIKEIPLPLFARHLSQKTLGKRRTQPLPFHVWFERAAARRLRRSNAAIAVGSETCALHWFEAAKRQGMRCVLDCHGIPTPFLDECLQRAAREFDLPVPAPLDSDAMVWHKRQERRLADVMLCCSELQRDIWRRLGEPEHKLRAIPLWVDTGFWKPAHHRPSPELPLRVLTVGSGTLAKGFPYLLKASDQLSGDDVELTVVGSVAEELRPLLARCRRQPALRPYLTREQLRDFFGTQHLLVMPSLGDSFGFVAMEAMACGLPVIVTEHCGVPVPDPAWRVPAHDAASLADRLSWYLRQPQRLVADSALAVAFAQRFPPSEYRKKVRDLFAELLGESS